jgi:hypothetical protein
MTNSSLSLRLPSQVGFASAGASGQGPGLGRLEEKRAGRAGRLVLPASGAVTGFTPLPTVLHSGPEEKAALFVTGLPIINLQYRG